MEFGPQNPIVKLCLQGMAAEAQGDLPGATLLFQQAWGEAHAHFEKYLAAWYLARCEPAAAARLGWYEVALRHAIAANDISASSGFSSLHMQMAACHNELGNAAQAAGCRQAASQCAGTPPDNGPFYHGTRAQLQVGDLLSPGFSSNYQSDLLMNHVYFTAMPNGAGLAAALAQGTSPERVYVVVPTGDFENDPNVTDKKFPGNPTRSYRTSSPLKIVAQLDDWARQSAEQVAGWRQRLDSNTGEIIN